MNPISRQILHINFLVGLFLLGVKLQLAQADCYPGDTRYNQLVQEIYQDVTSNSIPLEAHGPTPISRTDLCNILVKRHNRDKNPHQRQTNRNFLGEYIFLSKCMHALTFTTGYKTASGWQEWAGNHSGMWYGTTKKFTDEAEWYDPTVQVGKHAYVYQKVRFDSKDRIDKCAKKDKTGASCRYGWNQSGKEVKYVWGWDPKNNDCSSDKNLRGKVGTVVGFTFNDGGANCIVWVTKQEAFLECVKNSHRTSVSSGPESWEGYGQWTLS